MDLGEGARLHNNPLGGTWHDNPLSAASLVASPMPSPRPLRLTLPKDAAAQPDPRALVSLSTDCLGCSDLGSKAGLCLDAEAPVLMLEGIGFSSYFPLGLNSKYASKTMSMLVIFIRPFIQAVRCNQHGFTTNSTGRSGAFIICDLPAQLFGLHNHTYCRCSIQVQSAVRYTLGPYIHLFALVLIILTTIMRSQTSNICSACHYF